MVAAETVEMGRHRPLVAGRAQPQVDIVEPALPGHGGDGGDQPLGEAGVVLADAERSGTIRPLGTGRMIIDEDEIEIGRSRHLAPAKLAKAPHFVRIIGGQWKRTRLAVADKPGLRPTPDRVRETLFNWLASLAGVGGGELPAWHCIDAFAGTGALGLEAASRGAAEVLLLERDARLAQALRAACERLGAQRVQVQATDALRWMASQAGGTAFDIVFVDPPFDRGLWEAALDAARPLLSADGRLYLEADRPFEADRLAAHGYALLRHARAGQVHAHLMAGAPPPEGSAPA